MAPRPMFERRIVLTLGIGAVALAAAYYARRSPGWEPAKRALVALAFLTLAGLVVLSDWVSRRGTRPPRKR